MLGAAPAVPLWDPVLGARRQVTEEEWGRRIYDPSVPGSWRIGTQEELDARAALIQEHMTRFKVGSFLVWGGLVFGGYKLWGTKGAIGVGAGAPALVFVAALALGNR